MVARAVDNEAPYFVDMVSEQVAQAFPGLTAEAGQVDVYTTLDLNLQRAALDAVRNGLANVDRLLARKRRPQPAQAALIAIDPRTGEILAMVGGRSYNESQYNRAVAARRQPGSVFKPFVYLAAFERAADEGRTDLTPASMTIDEPSTFSFDDQVWEPRNYDEYDGEITFRRALAMSRNLATIHVGETVGFDRVAALWRRVGVGTPPQAVPAITLGVFELTPLEVAQAYTLFVNEGNVRPLTSIRHVQTARGDIRPKDPTLHGAARADTTFLVTSMMRSVLNEGTARRRARRRIRARRRRQDGHDQRSARCVVRRLHARAAQRGLGRLRRQSPAVVNGHAGRAANLDGVHEASAGRPAERRLRASGRHHVRRHRPRYRQAGAARLPARLQRVVPRRAPSPPNTANCIAGNSAANSTVASCRAGLRFAARKSARTGPTTVAS